MDAEKDRGGNERAEGGADFELVRDDEMMKDIVEPTVFTGMTLEEFEEKAHIEVHKRGGHHGISQHHVDLNQEEYTPEEVARMMGTSLEVVMHAVWQGELKAEKHGRDVVCITHSDVVDWLRRRGPGI